MKQPQLSDFPLNDETPLIPNKILFIRSGGALSLTTSFIDITDPLDAPNIDVDSPSIVEDAELRANTATAPTFLELRREAWYKRSYSAVIITGSLESVVATMSSPLLDLGHWKLVFPTESPHSSHNIDLRPAGMGRRADIFVKDSVPYFWDVIDTTKLCKLFKVEGQKRVEVARFVAKRAHDHDGTLMLDGTRVDDVLAALTCAAVLNRSDSFRK